MPILIPADTKVVLGPNAERCESRSLFLDRFANPAARDSGDDHPRRDWFNALLKKPAVAFASSNRQRWIAEAVPEPQGAGFYAQLQSRLMINMAGGAMENAGLCLDRFGLPYIPGSAVKGCGRRAALAALREWCETGQKPRSAAADRCNLFETACAPFASPVEMLTAIARIFGWGEQDWKTRAEVLKGVTPTRGEDDAEFQQRCQKLWEEKRSDLAWTCGDHWEATRAESLVLLGSAPTPGATDGTVLSGEAEGRRGGAPANRRGARAPRLKDFAGSVSFLPAYPVDMRKTGKVEGLHLEVPALGKLDLDVVTCHHRDYYGDTLPAATDSEEPNPVVFPAVAPGHVFSFALAPLRGADTQPLDHARTWLKTGLETFGLGAKANAGYGWFQDVTDGVHRALKDADARQEAEQLRQREEERRKAKEAERVAQAQALKAATANMTSEEKADYEQGQLREDQFRGRLEQFARREKSEQEAVIRAMRLPADQAGSRRQFWDDLKLKAQKGGKPAQIEQAIRQLSKQMFPGKDGKMP